MVYLSLIIIKLVTPELACHESLCSSSGTWSSAQAEKQNREERPARGSHRREGMQNLFGGRGGLHHSKAPLYGQMLAAPGASSQHLGPARACQSLISVTHISLEVTS